MSKYLDKAASPSLDRRQFLQVAGAVGALAATGLAGIDNSLAFADENAPSQADLEEGKWVPFNCTTMTCAYRCLNQAYVVDGVITRQGTADIHEDTEDFPQFRPCAKGLSTRRIVTSAERLKYPMKRKNWNPGGQDYHPELRGVDEWERISWEEAIDLIAGEFTRIKDAYGNRSFLSLGELEPHLVAGLIGSPILNAIGGCLTTWGQASQGGFPVVGYKMRGAWSMGVADSQDRIGLRHSKLIVFWGTNPAWSASGGDMHAFLSAKKAGAKIIFIDPYFNETAKTVADEWIPCHVGTDGALLEALAYEMIVNNLQDQEFLDKYCLGFDADHMPEDAKTDENFKDYILGTYDGIPKTAERASEICGTPVEMIKNLAYEIATTKPMAWKSSGAPARTYYGNRYAQLFFTVGWMTGNVGKIGSEVSAGASQPMSHLGTPGGTGMVAYGASGYKYPPNPICTEPRGGGYFQAGYYNPEQEYGIPFTQTFKAIVDGKYALPGPNGRTQECDIRCIVRDDCHQPASQQSGGWYVQDAFRKETVEFVLVQDRYLVTDAQYADIVLPVTTSLEDDYSLPSQQASELCLFGQKVIEPYFESKSDPEIFFMLCDKLGIGEDIAPRMTVKQSQMNKVMGATILSEDGTRVPLVAITQEDLDAEGVTGEPHDGLVPFAEFKANGGYQIERKDGDHFINIFHKAFIDDPEANPVNTASGKYEIYCQSLKDYYEWCCFNDIDALPKYKAAPQGAEQAREEAEYKYQLITQHTIRHSHSSFGNVKQLDEMYPMDFVMSAYDAGKAGFKKGDWVLVTSMEGGQVVRRLNVIPQLMPGTVFLGQGSWRQIDQATGIDMGGNTNTLCRSELLGDAYQCYNGNLVKIELYNGPTPELDYKRAPIVAGL
ncbi:MAG: molybdopterin-dependent oxidoreductase [Coriobacteriales bacterium]|nr:molybdopterin-dependent oxidoreductase [Coriobacteriales bacterium]